MRIYTLVDNVLSVIISDIYFFIFFYDCIIFFPLRPGAPLSSVRPLVPAHNSITRLPRTIKVTIILWKTTTPRRSLRNSNRKRNKSNEGYPVVGGTCGKAKDSIGEFHLCATFLDAKNDSERTCSDKLEKIISIRAVTRRLENRPCSPVTNVLVFL